MYIIRLLLTWRQWETELGDDSAALKERHKQWVLEAREYFEELNQIFTNVKNWAVKMWFEKPEFVINYAFSHRIIEKHLDSKLRKEFEDLALEDPANEDWQVPLPTQRILRGSYSEGGKLGGLLRCLIRETIAPVRAHVSSMLLHSILLLYFCRASELMSSSSSSDQQAGDQALEDFFRSRYLSKDLVSFVWDMYGALQSDYYEKRLDAFIRAKQKQKWKELDLSQLKTVYQDLCGKTSRLTQKEAVLKALAEHEQDLQTKAQRRKQAQTRISTQLGGFTPNSALWTQLGDLIWQVPKRIELEPVWKNLRNFFAGLYVLQEFATNPQASPEPEIFVQKAQLWMVHYSTLKDLFAHPDPYHLANWFKHWGLIVAKLHNWRRIRGARLLFLGKLLKQKALIRAAHQLGTKIDPKTLADIHTQAPLDCITPGEQLPIQFANGNLNLSQDQDPIMPYAFLHYYVVDVQGTPYTSEAKRVAINKVTSSGIPPDPQPIAQIELTLKVPPSLAKTRQQTLIENQPTSKDLTSPRQRWTTTRKFGTRGLPPFLVHQNNRKYHRPTLIFSKLDSQGLPTLHFGLETIQVPKKDKTTKKEAPLIQAPPKPKEIIRVLSLDLGTRNLLGYSILECPKKKAEELVKLLKDKSRTLETLASLPEYQFSNWDIRVLYSGVLAGLNPGARAHAEQLVWQQYKNILSDHFTATLEAQDRRLEKELARIDRKMGHRYIEIQVLQKRKDQAKIVKETLAHLLGREEDQISLRVVKKYLTSLPGFAKLTRNEQVQRWLQHPDVKTTSLVDLTPKAFWRVSIRKNY